MRQIWQRGHAQLFASLQPVFGAQQVVALGHHVPATQLALVSNLHLHQMKQLGWYNSRSLHFDAQCPSRSIVW